MPERPPRRSFAIALGLVLIVGAGLRIAYVLAVTQNDQKLYDAAYYTLTARAIAEGDSFFDDPFAAIEGERAPGADHPPLAVVALVPPSLLPGEDARDLAMRLTMVAVGTGTIALVALIGRAAAGPTVGIIAGVIAALDPNLWMNDGLIMSESLAVLLSAALLLGAWRALTGSPPRRDLVVLGVGVGLAVLARAELGLLLPALITPAVWVGTRGRPVLERARLAAVPWLVAGLVLAPWLAFNAARFDTPVLVSTSTGIALRSSNCASVYDLRVGWADVDPPCVTPSEGFADQSTWDQELRQDALEHVRGHLGRVPAVIAARLGRAWYVWQVDETAGFGEGEGRPTWATWLGAATTWVLVPLAVAGAIIRRRRGDLVWPFVAAIASATAVFVLVAGVPRYRVGAEPALIVLAACGVAALWSGISTKTSDRVSRPSTP